MMKRVLCLVLCLMMAIPAALAEMADTLPKRFARQLTGGNGIRGKISVKASGVAEWLNVLLPFTSTDIQVRAIGEKQGDLSASVMDDDDWQIRFYAENGNGQEVGTTWLYGDPEAVYFSSELLPDTLLTIPVEQVNLLYQIFKGEYAELFFSFDPMGLQEPGQNGNASAYQPIANLLGVPAEEWEKDWMPVLEKYFLQLDLWLTSYGDSSVFTDDAGSLAMSATYVIPVEEIKKEAKYLIGQMLYDNDLLELLLPYVTMEQRITYLNPSMLYFYEACIDAIQLEGDVVLSRELSGLGEAVSMSVTLPLPQLPDTITGAIGELAADIFGLPYTDLLAGMNQISLTTAGNETTVSLSGEKRTVTMVAVQSVVDENSSAVNGTLRVVPNVGVDEKALSAAYTYTSSHQVWQDESYLDHDMTTTKLAVESDLGMLSADDPFRSSYLEFDPLSIEWTVDYRNNAYQENSAVQVNVTAAANLPDAKIDLDMVLRITTKVEMVSLPVDGGEDFTALSDERKAELLDTLTLNAQKTMASLYTAAVEEDEDPEVTAVPAVEAEPQPTEVPPLSE